MNKTKICSQCGKEKSLLEFYKRKGSKDGFCPHCKICGNFYTKQYRKNNPEHNIWMGFIERCYTKNNERYKDYGGRGIKVCDRWLNSFENFLADMGPKPSPKLSIDRIDNNGCYCFYPTLNYGYTSFKLSQENKTL